MQQQPLDMAHVLGTIAKWVVILVVFGFSLTLSWMFFLGITPHDKPWFTYTALGLTEGGFIGWMLVFMLTRHHPIHKSIAVVMACACAVCSLVVAGYEFYILMATRYDVTTNPLIIQGVSILLEIIFASHMAALIIDLLAGYFARPGNNFRNRNLIPVQQQQRVSIQELQAMQNAITGYLQAVEQQQPSEPDFLDGRQLPQFSEQTELAIAGLGRAVNAGANTLMKKAKDFTKRGKQAAPVPGQTSTSTNESGSVDENSSSQDGN